MDKKKNASQFILKSFCQVEALLKPSFANLLAQLQS